MIFEITLTVAWQRYQYVVFLSTGCESTDSSVSTLVYIVTASVLSFLFVFAIVVLIGVWKYQR